MPCPVNTSPAGVTADGATGVVPMTFGWEIRPACMIWAKMTPPSACTASATARQPSTCSSVCRPGVRG